MMYGVTFESIKRFLFDTLVVVSFTVTLLKVLAIELKGLRRAFFGKRRQS
jgi:hypothetical protein